MKITTVTSFDKTIICPPDKSITHRAVMLNAAAEGRAVIENPLLGQDCLSTVECMRALGAEIDVSQNKIKIKGGIKSGNYKLYAGNSGTTIRLLTGLLCGRKVSAVISGDKSLSERPMKRIIEPLSQMGADIGSADGKPPLIINGKPLLAGITYAMPVASAQVKSALLLAGLCAEGVTSVVEPVSSRNHTEIMLKAMGASIAAEGKTVSVKKSGLSPVSLSVPGDISSAAYPLVLAACVKGGRCTVKNVGLNPTRTGILEVLKDCGADLEIVTRLNCGGGEESGDVTVRYRPGLKPFTVEGTIIPRLIDEIPALAVLACFIEGESTVSGASELKVKESDRILTVVNAVNALGGSAKERPDGFVIGGKGFLKGGGKVKTYGDHRIAMAFACAAAASIEGGEIEDAGCVSVSWPNFYSEVL